MQNKTIIMPGGSGFLGQNAAEYFYAKGYDIVILTRGKSKTEGKIKYINWDAETFGEWTNVIDGAHAIINFTGKSVDCLPTKKNKHEFIESRVNSVSILSKAIQQAKNPPKIFIQAASLAIYGNTTQTCTEQAPYGEGFPVEVCKIWEAEFNKYHLPETRKVALRIGFILGNNGGALAPLVKLAKMYMGGTVGSGKQYISWAHIADFNKILGFVLENDWAEGVYNATGTQPVTNAVFMRILRKVLHKPWSPPTPAILVKIGAYLFMRTDPNLALQGRKCIPERLLNQGFHFEYNDLEKALKNLLQPKA